MPNAVSVVILCPFNNLWGATRAAHQITKDITGVEFVSNGT